MPKRYTAKPHSEIGMRIFKSADRESTYLVLRSGANPNASEQHPRYNVFVEVEAKEAAMACGSGLTTTETTWHHWDKLWNSAE
jgi:hypothetical protein